MRIEIMDSNDLADVTNLAEQLGYQASVEQVRTRFTKIQQISGSGLFVAKLDSGTVVGFIQVNEESRSIVERPRADIAALIVEEKHRGHGIGRSLLHAAELWAKDHQLPLVRVRSNTKRQDALRFYKKEGYDHSKTSNVFTKSIE